MSHYYVLEPRNFNDIDDTSQACADADRNPFHYVQGWSIPNFPVPAIRCGYEWGWSLSECSASLMFREQGVYCD